MFSITSVPFAGIQLFPITSYVKGKGKAIPVIIVPKYGVLK
jgi:hypothetical protein